MAKLIEKKEIGKYIRTPQKVNKHKAVAKDLDDSNKCELCVYTKTEAMP